MPKIRKLWYKSGLVEQPYFQGQALTKWTHDGQIVWQNGEETFKDGHYFFRQSGNSGYFLELDPDNNTVDYAISSTHSSVFYSFHWNETAIFSVSGTTIYYILAENPGVYQTATHVLTASASNVWAVKDGFIYNNSSNFYLFSFSTMSDSLIYTHANTTIGKRNSRTWASGGCIFTDSTAKTLYSLSKTGTLKTIYNYVTSGYGAYLINNIPMAETDSNIITAVLKNKVVVGALSRQNNNVVDFIGYWNDADFEGSWASTSFFENSSDMADAAALGMLSNSYFGLRYFRTSDYADINNSGVVRIYARSRSADELYITDTVLSTTATYTVTTPDRSTYNIYCDINPINTVSGTSFDANYDTVRATQGYTSSAGTTYNVGPGWSAINSEANGSSNPIVRLNKQKKFETVNAEYYCYSNVTVFFDKNWDDTDDNIALQNNYLGAVVWNTTP